MTLLLWDAHRGQGEVRHEGVSVQITAAPDVGIEHMQFVEYSPAVRVFELRQSAEARRDLTSEERQRICIFLNRISTAARAALTEGATRA